MIAPLAICIGASLGALARWRLGLWLSPGGLIPWGTLAANLIGGYLIGVCVAVFQALPQLIPGLAPGAGHRLSGRAHNLLQLVCRSGGHAAAAALPAGPGHHRCSLAGLTAAHHRGAA